MSSSKNAVENQVRKASERLTGLKFCFSCSKERPVEGGGMRKNSWKCAHCLKRISTTWYGREPKGGAK